MESCLRLATAPQSKLVLVVGVHQRVTAALQKVVGTFSNVDLLSCELNEQFEEVQQCNYPDSPTGGICPYTFGTQTFRIEESRDGSYRMFRPLPVSTVIPKIPSPYCQESFCFQTYEDEVEMLDLLVRPRYVMSALLSGPGSQANIRQMHALVNPHQILRITQRSLHCGSYLMRTNELKFDYGTFFCE